MFVLWQLPYLAEHVGLKVHRWRSRRRSGLFKADDVEVHLGKDCYGFRVTRKKR